jgi:hypothetical protein
VRQACTGFPLFSMKYNIFGILPVGIEQPCKNFCQISYSGRKRKYQQVSQLIMMSFQQNQLVFDREHQRTFCSKLRSNKYCA